jgi:peptidoglycan glycosyltransferase
MMTLKNIFWIHAVFYTFRLGAFSVADSSSLSLPLRWQEESSNLIRSSDSYSIKKNDLHFTLTLKPDLQELVTRNIQRTRGSSIAIVILDTQTGKILALGEKKEAMTKQSSSLVTSAYAPAASLIKIITAGASIEKTSLSPDIQIPFSGGCGKLHYKNWLRDKKSDRQHMSLAKAFGLSCNTVFARLALYWSGLSTLNDTLHKYYFNSPILTDLEIEPSYMDIPDPSQASPKEVGELGAGFAPSRISPIHAALLSQTVGFGGKMMTPYIVSNIYKEGKLVYTGVPKVLSDVFKESTSNQLISMMQETVLTGTSRRYFRSEKKFRFDIAGKTGTLKDMDNRNVLHTWFSGIAPLGGRNPIAISVLVSSPTNNPIRASEVARKTLSEYLRSSDLL